MYVVSATHFMVSFLGSYTFQVSTQSARNVPYETTHYKRSGQGRPIRQQRQHYLSWIYGIFERQVNSLTWDWEEIFGNHWQPG